MTDEYWENYCARLVSEIDSEPDLYSLFSCSPGSWLDLATFRSLGSFEPQSIFVSWLPDPLDHANDFRNVIFLNCDTRQSMIALYNYDLLRNKLGEIH